MGDLEMTDAKVAETPAIASIESKEQSRAEEIVRAWFDRCIRNSAVSMNVPAFNHVQAAVEDLVEALKEG